MNNIDKFLIFMAEKIMLKPIYQCPKCGSFNTTNIEWSEMGTEVKCNNCGYQFEKSEAKSVKLPDTRKTQNG